jgi:hypothetical protein
MNQIKIGLVSTGFSESTSSPTGSRREVAAQMVDPRMHGGNVMMAEKRMQ